MKSFIIDGSVRQLTEKEYKKIEAILAPKEEGTRWEIEKGKEYWTLVNTGATESTNVLFREEESIKSWNDRCLVFATKEEAEREDQRRLALGRIRKYVCANNVKMDRYNEYRADWNDNYFKYQIEGWKHDTDRPSLILFRSIDTSSHGLIFKTAEDRQMVLDNCKEDLEILLKK